MIFIDGDPFVNHSQWDGVTIDFKLLGKVFFNFVKARCIHGWSCEPEFSFTRKNSDNTNEKKVPSFCAKAIRFYFILTFRFTKSLLLLKKEKFTLKKNEKNLFPSCFFRNWFLVQLYFCTCCRGHHKQLIDKFVFSLIFFLCLFCLSLSFL